MENEVDPIIIGCLKELSCQKLDEKTDATLMSVE